VLNERENVLGGAMKAKILSRVIVVSLLFISSITAQDTVRVEKDLLGPKEIPASAYYGVQTARALENFQISDITINHYPGFVEAWAIVKLAAAKANTDVGVMTPEKLAAIEKASQAVLDGKYHEQFLVDWYQGGAGTSTNMNANEVLANIALELTGHKKGEYQYVDPHDDLICRSRPTILIRLRSKLPFSCAMTSSWPSWRNSQPPPDQRRRLS
jgi:aspartate ammonia-lyase